MKPFCPLRVRNAHLRMLLVLREYQLAVALSEAKNWETIAKAAIAKAELLEREKS